MAEKGFFGKLFDLSFTEFVTIGVVKVLYVIFIILSAIVGIAVLIGGITNLGKQPLVGLLMIILSPVAFLLYVLLSRIWLEILVVIFRIADNTGELVEQGKSQPSA